METDNPIVIVTHHFESAPERVFDAWLDPKLIAQWMIGLTDGDEEMVSVNVNARVGGRFSFVVRRSGQLIDHVGQYLELVRPQRLAFTWGVAPETGDNSRVTIDLVPLGNGTELTLTHEMDPEWASYAKQTRQGWAAILAAVERTVTAAAAAQ